MTILRKFTVLALSPPSCLAPVPAALAWIVRRLGLLAPRHVIGPGCLAGAHVKRVLIVGHGGNLDALLCATPLIAELERCFPGVEVDVLATAEVASSVFGNMPGVRRVVIVAAGANIAFAWLRAIFRFRLMRHDLGIDLGGPHEWGRLILALTRPRALIGIAEDQDKRWSFAMFSVPDDAAKVPVYLLRRALVCEEQRLEAAYPPIALRLTSAERQVGARIVANLCDRERKSIAIGVFASVPGSPGFTHGWWKRLLEELHTLCPDLTVVEIRAGDGRSRLGSEIASYHATEPRELVSLLSNLHGLIIADPALRQVACASATPTIALHSSTDPGTPMPLGCACRDMAIEARSPHGTAVELMHAFALARSADAQARVLASGPYASIERMRKPAGEGMAPEVRARDWRNKLHSVAGMLLLGILVMAFPTVARAGGPLGIDHVVAYDNSGIWKRSYQTDLAIGTAVFVVGGALWAGDDSKFGNTLWRSVDAMALTAVTTEAMKFTFARERPSQTSDPNRFFSGHGNQSFPSGEVAEISAAVTPLMMAYGPDHPAVYALAVLPLYDAIARVKVHGHWQSDVLIGAAVGAGIGYYAGKREHSLIVGLLPGGFSVGFQKSFQ